MMHKAWGRIEEVPYCVSRSYVKFQGHTALKIVEFYPNWAFPDCNSSLNSPMAMKCCTKLETAKERCPIVFQGHPSNFKVTRYKTSPILTQIGHFMDCRPVAAFKSLRFALFSYHLAGPKVSTFPRDSHRVCSHNHIRENSWMIWIAFCGIQLMYILYREKLCRS